MDLIEWNSQRVLLTQSLSESYASDSQILVNNFNRNKDRYKEGKHYFLLQGDELKEFRAKNQIDLPLNTNKLYLWTKKGSWLHAKSLNTDEAWEAYEALVDDYYEKLERNNLIDITQLTPELQMFKQLWDGLAKNQIEQAETKRIAEAASEKAEKIEGTINNIQEILLQRNQDWRDSVNNMLNAASFRLGGNYRDVRTKSYQVLEERAHCDLNRRLRNLSQRLVENGATKSKVASLSKMDVIESDPKLKEIYTSVVKEISIGSIKIS